jgi:hypothetical protein
VDALILLVSAAAATFMAGVIWVIQLVHYPLFALADPVRFSAFHAAHSARITLIVGPAMLTEIASSGLFVFAARDELERRVAIAGLALVVVAWGTTALCSIPAHGRLAGGFDQAAHTSLVSTNVIRTVAWTAHAALKLLLVARRLGVAS